MVLISIIKLLAYGLSNTFFEFAIVPSRFSDYFPLNLIKLIISLILLHNWYRKNSLIQELSIENDKLKAKIEFNKAKIIRSLESELPSKNIN